MQGRKYSKNNPWRSEISELLYSNVLAYALAAEALTRWARDWGGFKVIALHRKYHFDDGSEDGQVPVCTCGRRHTAICPLAQRGTDNPTVAAEWWREWPGAGIGLINSRGEIVEFPVNPAVHLKYNRNAPPPLPAEMLGTK